MHIKPIRTEQNYDEALSRVEILMDVKPNTKEFDELEILVTLIEVYEAKHYHIKEPDPIEAIKFRMEQEGLKQSDLIKVSGSKSRVSEILNKRRKLTLKMIRNLHNTLKIPFESLFREYELKPLV